MRKLLITILLMGLAIPAYASGASDYKANYWASWTNVTTQITWVFPYKSRELSVHNGSSIPVCVAFNGATMTAGCTSPVGFSTTGDQKVFQLGANQIMLLQDFVTSSVTLASSGAAASPVSVVVTY